MSMPREKPATRKELHGFRAEVRRDFKKNDERWKKNDEQWKKSDQQFAELRQEIAASAAELRIDFEAIAARLHEEITTELRIDFEAIGARLLRAQQESFRAQFGVLDDKYRDLPERVATLEDHVGITR